MVCTQTDKRNNNSCVNFTVFLLSVVLILNCYILYEIIRPVRPVNLH